MINLDSILKSRDKSIANKGLSTQSCGSPVVMYGCESWTIKKAERGSPKMVEESDGETTFSPTNSSKDPLNAEQIPQNNFRTLAEDTRHPERQPMVFKRR